MMSGGIEIWGRRLKEVREEKGLSQKQLGVLAGLDPFVASTRINRYERGIHKADFQITKILSSILDTPAAYFYAEDDQLAKLMLIYHRLPAKKKVSLLSTAQSLCPPPINASE